ncbi:MAG TPA: biopolymer transporter ExbD [Candidatus Omnitrophota bacterium]|mgnify:CR=1 FL=1|nr:biopolymer transporter ExbD [Candidatus Omnitrophota bacterium]
MRVKAKAGKERPITEINITPFTDVVLVLLVIFMITTPLILQSNIKVNLPTVTSAKSDKIVNQVIITVTEKDGIYLGDKKVSHKDLETKIAAMRSYNPDLMVVLFSDGAASFKNVASVLGILNAAGVKDLNIAVNTEPSGKAPAQPAKKTGKK